MTIIFFGITHAPCIITWRWITIPGCIAILLLFALSCVLFLFFIVWPACLSSRVTKFNERFGYIFCTTLRRRLHLFLFGFCLVLDFFTGLVAHYVSLGSPRFYLNFYDCLCVLFGFDWAAKSNVPVQRKGKDTIIHEEHPEIFISNHILFPVPGMHNSESRQDQLSGVRTCTSLSKEGERLFDASPHALWSLSLVLIA